MSPFGWCADGSLSTQATEEGGRGGHSAEAPMTVNLGQHSLFFLSLQPWHHVWFCGQPPGKDPDQKDPETGREQLQRFANTPGRNPKGKTLQPAHSMAPCVCLSESLCVFGSAAEPYKKPVNPHGRVLPFKAVDAETQPESDSQNLGSIVSIASGFTCLILLQLFYFT